MKFEICFPFVGDSIGGSHISTFLLIKELKAKGHKVKIILHEKNILSKYLIKKKIDFEILKLSKFPEKGFYFLNLLYFLFINFFTIRNYLNKNNFDIIHGNDLRVNLCWGFANIGLKNFVWHQRNFLKKKSFMNMMIYLFSNHVIAISETVYECFPKFLRKKVKIIYNPFEKYKLKTKSRKYLNIAFIGKDNYQKGFDIFFNIFLKLRQKSNLRFNAYCPKFLSRYNYKNFKTSNFLDIKSIILKNDLLIAPSRKEGFGRTVLEFAFQKKKVLASNIKSHEEINKKFAKFILVKSNETEEYLKILKNKKIPKAKIIKKNIKKLSLKYHANKITSIYKELLNES